jgi:signal transduction histidine kinase
MPSSGPDLGHLLALVAHELRSPVAVVAGSLSLLLDERFGPLTQAQRAMLRPANTSSGRLVALLDDLSELGRLYRGEAAFGRSRTSLAHLVGEATGAFVPLAESTVSVQARIAPDAEVVADQTRLARAITALCQASARGLGADGTVLVGLERPPEDASVVVLTIHPGLGEKVVSRLGDVADPVDAFEGVGFELPLARAVIAAEGGELTVGAETIAVRLPLAPPVHHA